jgi:hypothetical protein
MGKGYKGILCVYCVNKQSVDGNHIICREFFPVDNRANLPKAPSCKECNNDKSRLEHYLTTIMPFGATHPKASIVIDMTSPRLAKNKKLASKLNAGVKHILKSHNGGPWTPTMTLPLDGVMLIKLSKPPHR